MKGVKGGGVRGVYHPPSVSFVLAKSSSLAGSGRGG
jgi:hypothetical protein